MGNFTSSEAQILKQFVDGCYGEGAWGFRITKRDAELHKSLVAKLVALGYIQRTFTTRTAYSLTQAGVEWLIKAGVLKTSEVAPEVIMNQVRRPVFVTEENQWMMWSLRNDGNYPGEHKNWYSTEEAATADFQQCVANGFEIV